VKSAAAAALAIAALANPYDRLWASVQSTAARHLDVGKPQKRSRTSSHKQNARKAKKGGKP
jgi:hypothetical protein